ncbi:MAG: DUF6273 domain-containing protein, partial [Lachnospiraceae bacterium]|nr:DUF6273 domain-containing protein [Lachnospiraceae bacterium]
MAIFKCKMCGGELQFNPGESLGTCDYCGTNQTLPKIMDENIQGLFNRANVLRMKAEFDKAAEIYEKILQASGTEAEAYWGLILCKYGIEYVEDPATFKRVPTCHRASYDAVTADDDYKMAIQYADISQKAVYEAEAKAIDEIQKGILTLAQKEDPYDVFICYKETDESGNRTQDSVIANDIYYQLTQQGFKVFYAAITLEDKLGQEYEPYIFSALNSAKVMLAIGTKPEYFNAVWVKNEWSRFLKIMKKDRARVLIPCYRDMDAYELPEEFAHLQAQDMGKIGFINDVVRGIKKVIVKEDASAQPQVVVQQTTAGGSNTDALLKRAYLVLEDGDYGKADELFEEVLNQDPECAEAYFGKFLVENKVPNYERILDDLKGKYAAKTKETLSACDEETAHIRQMAEENSIPDFYGTNEIIKMYEFNRSYQSALSCRKDQKQQQLYELGNNKMLSRAKQFAKGEYKEKLDNLIAEITNELDNRIAEEEKTDPAIINKIKEDYTNHIAKTDEEVKTKRESILTRLDKDYDLAIKAFDSAERTKNSAELYENAKSKFISLKSYKNSPAYVKKCDDVITQVKLNQIEEAKRKRLKKKRIITVSISSVVAVIAVVLLITKVAIPEIKYSSAKKAMKAGNYKAAITKFENLGKYKYSKKYINESKKYIKYNQAMDYYNNKNYSDAYGIFEELGEFNNSKEMIQKIKDESVKNVDVGNKLYFGKYWWRVLDKKDNNVLIITDKVIDIIPYNRKNEDTNWIECTLRKYLNSDFINNTFSNEEISMINETTLDAQAGNRVIKIEDKVFCLSEEEVKKYFKDNDDRKAEDINEKVRAGGEYWLRTPGGDQYSATSGSSSGDVVVDWCLVIDDTVGIRPAMWIKTNGVAK